MLLVLIAIAWNCCSTMPRERDRLPCSLLFHCTCIQYRPNFSLNILLSFRQQLIYIVARCSEKHANKNSTFSENDVMFRYKIGHRYSADFLSAL